MKNLRLLLLLTIAALVSHTSAFADSYDSDQATIQKAGANSAKVMIGSKTSTVPIMFDDGASWDSVKDHYEVDPSIATGLEKGTMMISVGSDGTLSFKACSMKCSMKSKK